MDKTSSTRKKTLARVYTVPVSMPERDLQDNNSITFTGLDPILGSLGVLIGLLSAKPGPGNSTIYELNPAWFTDPITNIRNGVTASPQQFESLLSQVLGQVGGSALGIPVQDPALLGTWYPIKNGETPTGFYIVSYIKGEGEQAETVLGLGVLNTWNVPDASPLLKVNVWGLLPFVRIGNGSFNITFDSPGYPISIGISAEGGVKDQPLVNIAGLSFDGVKFSAMVDLPAADPFSVSLEVLSLKLPGELVASNRSLADLLAVSGQEILDIASNLFIGALTYVFPGQDQRIRYISSLFGLSTTVPGLPNVKLPLLEWYDLFKAASDPVAYPGGVKALFFNWFNALCSDGEQLKAWITSLAGFLGNDQLNITGTGTRIDPYAVTILSVNSVGQLAFTVATDVADGGLRYFYPGLSLTGNNIPLGTSDTVFVIGASLELGSFGLSEQAVTASPDISFLFHFNLNNKTAGTPLIAYDGYSFGSLSGGLQLGTGGKIVPQFLLNTVVTPDSQYDSINLLSPGELANAGAAVLSEALSALIGVGQKSFSDNIAALIGLIAPASAGAGWPSALVPPFSPAGMVTSILNPVSALADYYSNVLSYAQQVDGKAAFSWMVNELALLLQVATDGTSITVDGDGSPAIPWRAGISLNGNNLPAYVTAYQQTVDGVMTLVLGVELMPVITIGSIQIAPSLNIDAISITFPHGDNGIIADWLPQIAAKLTLPQGFATPSIAGVVVSVSKAQLSAQWARTGGWSWSMYVDTPTLIVDGQNIALGQSLNFSRLKELEDLVRNSQQAFNPFLVAALGAVLTRFETRAGLLMTGALGLLPDISKSPIFPQGLQWQGFAQLSVSSLSDPWPDIRNQLAAAFNTTQTADSLLSLLSWTINNSMTTAPAIKGSGTFDDPYSTPLPKGFEAIFWYDTADKVLGIGAGRTDSWAYQQVNVDLSTRLNGIKYDLQNGRFVLDQQAPSLSFLCTLYNPAGLLVDLPASIGSLEKAIIGFNINLSDGNIKFTPVVTLVNITIPGQQVATYTLQDFLSADFHASMQSAFLAMLNAGIQKAITQVKEKPLFQTAYGLLEMLGLALERIPTRDAADQLYGINSAGWNALLANFDTFIDTQLQQLLSLETEREILFRFIADVLQTKLPDFPTAALELLSGLNICGPAEEGYPLYPQALLELVSDPVSGLKTRFEALFSASHTEELKTLIAELTKYIPNIQFGNFTFGADGKGVVSLSVLPQYAFTLGGLLNITGGIQMDLNNRQLTATLDLYCPKVGFTLDNNIILKFLEDTPEVLFTSALIWGDSTKPSAVPLQLIPFKTDAFLDQVAYLAPVYTLNIMLNAVFEEQLVRKYPLVQQIFKGLGLVQELLPVGKVNGRAIGQQSEPELWQMYSLLGILKDPLGWLLSDQVLGDNGKFSIAKLAAMLGNLPAVSSSNGISIAPVTNGTSITGLPYGFEIGITGAGQKAAFSFTAKDINIADDLGILNKLSFGVTLDQNYQPAFAGELTLSSGSKLPVAFYANTGYNEAFFLKIGQGSAAAPSGVSLQLLPFLGWGSLLGQAASLAAAALINQLVPTLLQKLSAAGASDFVNRLTTFGNLVDVQALVNNIINALNPAIRGSKTQLDLLEDVEAVALAWLKGLFTTAKAPDTVDAIIAMLSGVLSGLSRDNGCLLYKPGDQLPITIKTGLNSDSLLGLWVQLNLPSTQLLRIDIADTGVGVNTSDGTVHFNFGFHALVPLDGTTGPELSLSYVPGQSFTLDFDPLGDAANFSKQSDLCRELLPSFFPGDGDLGAKVGSWLLDVIKVVLPRYVSVLVLNIDKIKTWLETPIVAAANAPTPAILLEAMSLIVNDNNRYSLNTIDNLSKLTPGSFFGNLLLTLMKNKLTLLTFGTDNKGSIVVGPKDGTPDYYGVRLVAPNLKLAAIPNLVLQLGDNTPGNDEWIVKSGGKPGDPGIGFYLPVKSDNGNVSVDFGLFMMMLYNLGFDFVGTNGKPLVDLSRFKIGSVKPRAVFGLDFKGSNAPDVYFGAGITLDDIRISLSPASLASGGGNNPIANNILGSGTTDKYSNPPTDPAFSVTTAYSSNLWVNLKSSTGNGNEVILPVQRAFGPLYIDSLGLGWEDQQKLLDFLFTGSVDLAGLKASVVGLRVGVPVTTPTNFSAYTVDLDGLDISFRGGAVEINGGFVKTEITDGANTYVSYNGVAVIKAGTFSLMALGSYAEVPVSPNPGADTAPSLFIFAVLNAPLGGVPAFFITGVAAGFSFNRSIQIPNITEVQDFPLLKGLVDGSFAEGEDPGKALVALSAVVKPEVGQYWLAAGIKFTSFELITSSALLFFSFGKDWEVNLLGLSFASLPPRIPKSLALAYFELAIKVSFKPELGIISAEAQLTPNSFVLSNDCKVTGGFAFFLWYKTIVTKDYIIPAGDFVISLGGYHPSFQKPVYYPEVPRLGLQWKMDISVGSISIGGGAYFALCPTAVMAGGYINVAYQLGPLKAWLSAYANFLIEWKPFYFNVDIGITVGASFGTTIAGVSLTIKAELGAQLHLEGPPTHGHVHVDWYVISFTIPIGSGTTATDDKNLTWAAFADSFLPPPEAPETRSRNGVRLLNADPVQQVVKWAAEAGLQSENNDLWSIQPYPFSFSLKTSIPASLTTVANSDYSQPGIKVGVRPMGMMTDLNSPLTITITNAKGEQVNLKERNIRISAFSNGAPGALWSKDGLNKRQPPDPSKMLIPDASFGLVFDGDQYVFIGEVIPFPIINLAYTLGDPKLLPFKNTPGYPAAARYPDSDQATAYQVIMNSIMLPATVTRRNEVYTALQQSSIEAPLDPDLTVMASSANFILQALPVIARIGIYQNGGVPEAAGLVKRNAARSFAAPAETPLVEPRLLGMLKRYKVKRNTETGTRGAGRSLGVKSSWQHAGGLTRKSIPQSQTMKRGLAANTKTLYDGSVALWATDNRATTTLQLDGSLPVRVISFDAHGAILSYRYVAGERSFSLPQGTAQVAVQGYEADETMITGWQKDTHLSKVNGVWSLGDAAMIRVQNSQRIHVRSAHAETGVIDTAKLLRENYALGLDDQPVKGWIQAVFPGATGYLGVKVDKDAAPDVWIAADSIPGGSGTKKELVKKVTLTDGFLFIYQVPAAGTHPEYYGILATVRDQDSQITGMYGFSELPKSAKTKLKDLSLNNAGLDLSAETVSTVKVSIQSKL